MSGQNLFDQPSERWKARRFLPKKIVNSFKYLDTEDDLQLFRRYLHSLTFDPVRPLQGQMLTNLQVKQLKEIIDKLYKSYKERACNLNDIQGVWAILRFVFRDQISGLQLYLAFENLLEAVEAPHTEVNQSSIKEQYMDFNQQIFFQTNNCWKSDKNFMKALRVLEKSSRAKTLDKKMRECKEMLQILIKQKVSLLLQAKQFEERFQQFRKEAQNIVKEKKMISELQRMSRLQQNVGRMFNLVASDIGDYRHALEHITEQQYRNIHSLQHPQLFVGHSKPTSLFELRNDSIQDSMDAKQEHSIRETTNIQSSPCKRKLTYLENRRDSGSATKPKKIKLISRVLPRHRLVSRIFETENTRNTLMETFKKQNQDRKKQKRKKDKVQKFARNRLKKMSQIYYESDEQTRKIVNRARINRIAERGHESGYELSDNNSNLSEEEHDYDSSQEITMKRRRPTKLRGLYQASEKIADNRSEQGEGYQRNVQMIHVQRTEIKSDVLSQKKDPSCRFLKWKRQTKSNRQVEKLQNIEIRKIVLEDCEELLTRVNIEEYIRYLQQLEGKQIRKQILSVGGELLLRQNHLTDMDMIQKILALFMMSEDKHGSAFTAWQGFKFNYIDPMLRYSLTTNIYSSISDLLNNLSVSSYNEDLTLTSRSRKWFINVFKILKAYSHQVDLESKVIGMIYSEFTVPSKISQLFEAENRVSRSHFNLDNPYSIGCNTLNFRLAPSDALITFIIGSLIFQQTILNEANLNKDVLNASSQKYRQELILELEQRTPQYFKNEHYYKLTNALRQFCKAYQPQFSQKYFTSLVNIINLSLNRLKTDSLQPSAQTDTQIRDHVQFIQDVFAQFIQSKSREAINLLALTNVLLCQTKIKDNFRTIIEHDKLSMIIYPRVLALIWSTPVFQKEMKIYTSTIEKYIQQINEKGFRSRQNFQGDKRCILMLNDPLVAESQFQFLMVVYRNQIFKNLASDINTEINLNLKGISRFTDSSQKFGAFRSLIFQFLTVLYENFDRVIGQVSRQKVIDKKDKARLQTIEKILIFFLDKFIYPISPITELNVESALKYSPSHYFFGLQLVLHHNIFLRFFKIKLPFDSQIHRQLLEKYRQILEFYFHRYPVFLQGIEAIHKMLNINDNEGLAWSKNEKLTKWYLRIICDYIQQRTISKEKENRKPQQRYRQMSNLLELQISILTEQLEKKFLGAIVKAYGMYTISILLFPYNSQIMYSSADKIVGKYITDSVGAYTLRPQKIEKAIFFLDTMLKQLLDVCQNIQQSQLHLYSNQASTAAILQMKDNYFKKVIRRMPKQIAVLLIIGIILSTKHEYQSIPIDSVHHSFQQLSFFRKQLTLSYEVSGFLWVIQIIQQMKRKFSLWGILEQMLQMTKKVGENRKELGACLSNMLRQLHAPLKRLMSLQQEKSHVILGCTQLLTFAVKFEQVDPQCIKMYLFEMQLDSMGGSSLLPNLDTTIDNLHTVLRLFSAIKQNSHDFYKMKGVIDRYLQQLCNEQKVGQSLFSKNINKLLHCLRKMIPTDPKMNRITRIVLEKVLTWLVAPFINHSQRQGKFNAVKRMITFFEMMRDSTQERAVYEKLVIEKRQHFRKVVIVFTTVTENQENKSLKFTNFDEMVEECMVGPYSNFLDIKALIGTLIRSQVLSQSKKRLFRCLLSKFIRSVHEGMPEVEHHLVQWAQDQIHKLSESDLMRDKLSEWMDLDEDEQ